MQALRWIDRLIVHLKLTHGRRRPSTRSRSPTIRSWDG